MNRAASLHSIISEGLQETSESVKLLLPQKSSIKKVLRRAREAQNLNDPPLPQNRADFIVPEVFQTTSEGKRFLLYDSGNDDPNRIIIFSTSYNLKILSRMAHWFGDGTFDLCPSIFGQIYTIHGLYNKKIVPLVYVLLPNKNQDTYRQMLQVLKRLEPRLNPESFMMDLEMAMANAATLEFPDVDIRFCFFHLQEALYRHLASLGLKSRYDEDEAFNHKIKMLPAMSFVPPEDVRTSFADVVQEKFADEENAAVDDMLTYFQNTYIGSVIGRRERPPRFPIAQWSQYLATINDLPRTNNDVEGWHRGFQFLFSNYDANANLWHLLRAFRTDEANTRELVARLRTEGDVEPPSKKYASYSARIKKITLKYGTQLYQGDNVQYISDIAALLSL